MRDAIQDLSNHMQSRDADVWIAGFPCQPFSIAGNGEGFKDKDKGNLFYEILKIIDANTTRKCFQSWFHTIQRNKQLKSLQKSIKVSREKSTQRNYFIRWLALESDIKLESKM